MPHKLITVTFTKDVTKQDLKRFGEVAEHHARRAVLEVPKTKSREVAAQILSLLPVEDILIGEVPVEEVVRKIFIESHTPRTLTP